MEIEKVERTKRELSTYLALEKAHHRQPVIP
jgi:hypothetical protein